MLKLFSLKRLMVSSLILLCSLWSIVASSTNKQIVAVVKHEGDSGQYHIFFKDLTYSRFSAKEKKIISENKSVAEISGWPKADDGSYKMLSAVVNNVFNSQEQTYFFSDGTRMNLNHTLGNLIAADEDTEWWDLNVNWPKGADGKRKQVITIKKHEWSTDEIHFIFKDLTFSNFSKLTNQFSTGIYGNRSLEEYSYNGKKIWPRDPNNNSLKEVSAVIENVFSDAEKETTYFFNDGTKANFDITKKEFSPAVNSPDQWWDPSVNWPQMVLFNPTLHEIENLTVDYNSAGQPYYVIHANGRMQAPVRVSMRIRDKTTGNYIALSDTATADGKSLVMLYDNQLGPEEDNGSYLDIDGVGGSQFSSTWKISRSRGPFDIQITDNASTDLVKSPRNFNGWNTFTYYVSSVQTENEKQLCARVGIPNYYQYSCSDDSLNNYASIKAKPRIQYNIDDFNYTKLVPQDEGVYKGEMVANLYKLQPKNFTVRYLASKDLPSYTLTNGNNPTIITDTNKSTFLIGAYGGHLDKPDANGVIYLASPNNTRKTFSFPYNQNKKWNNRELSLDSSDGSIYLVELYSDKSYVINPVHDKDNGVILNPTLELHDNFGNLVTISIRKTDDDKNYTIY